MSYPHTDPALKQALKDSDVQTWRTPEYDDLLWQVAVKVSRRKRR